MKKLIASMLLAGLLIACQQQDSNPSNSNQIIPGHNIFGDVDKVPLPKHLIEHPFNKVGRLYIPNGTYCSASLVGKNLILTASHCLADSNFQFIRGAYQFYLGYDNGSFIAQSGVSHAWWGSLKPVQDGREHDWAFLQLNERLGEQYGYFGTTSQATLDQNDLTQAGYGTLFAKGEQMSVHEGCSLRKKLPERETYYHDCDISRGDSGGPLFRCDENNSCYIVAVNVADFRNNAPESLHVETYSDQYANVACGSQAFAKTLTELRKQFP